MDIIRDQFSCPGVFVVSYFQDGNMTMLDSTQTSQPANVLTISSGLVIPLSELHFRFSRSGGPGGQYVNRSETRVELLFDVARSPSLTEGQRARLLHRLASHIDGEGVLHIVSSATRSQAGNRADAVARFRSLMAAGIRQRKRRIFTKPSASSREKRLSRKRARSEIKKMRRKVNHSY